MEVTNCRGARLLSYPRHESGEARIRVSHRRWVRVTFLARAIRRCRR